VRDDARFRPWEILQFATNGATVMPPFPSLRNSRSTQRFYHSMGLLCPDSAKSQFLQESLQESYGPRDDGRAADRESGSDLPGSLVTQGTKVRSHHRHDRTAHGRTHAADLPAVDAQSPATNPAAATPPRSVTPGLSSSIGRVTPNPPRQRFTCQMSSTAAGSGPPWTRIAPSA
jgi:hypothetical protein